MNSYRNREEAVNTQLAILISKFGVSADAETIHVHGKHRPDVLFEMRGLRVVIEGKFADHSNSAELVLSDARKRVSAGLAHIAVAAIYPSQLRNTATAKLEDVLSRAELKYRIVTETVETEAWLEGNPASLMDALRRAQETLVQDDIVEQTAKSLAVYLDSISKLWMAQPGACDRLSNHLKMTIPKNENKDAANERRETAAKVSALILANAYIFQEQLSRSDEKVETLRKLRKEEDLIGATAEHWEWIWKNINYVPIFQLAGRILDELPASAATSENVKSLLNEAQRICAQQAALRHDLMGRIYHWLLHHAKYLGTYYTSVPSATLLLKLTFDLAWNLDFGNLKALAGFKVADLACGTGTLLMASAQAITDNFVKARADSERGISEKDLGKLHQTLMQNTLHGYDILPSAVHLTASTLALLAPEVAFRQMNLYVMPIGMNGTEPRLGSLDFQDSAIVATQFALDDSQLDVVRTGSAKTYYSNAEVPQLNLCVMNPPFVSSRYGNLLFGSLPEDRSALQKALSAQAKKIGVSATAGLGAMFVPLADKSLADGGRLAFVLPIALATGEAWSKVRNYLAQRYHLELVITSHDPERTNFSENTDLSEILFVARKKKPEEGDLTVYVGLRRNPTTIHEAIDMASRISAGVRKLKDKQGNLTVRNDVKTLCTLSSRPSPLVDENWTSAVFSQDALAEIHFNLTRYSTLRLPGDPNFYDLDLCHLGELGSIGYDVRDITDAFEVERGTENWTAYPGFWDHAADQVVQIAQKPNAFLTPRTEAIEGRKLKSAAAVWTKAGKMLLVSRLRTNTHKVVATGFDTCVLGNTWWAFDEGGLTSYQAKALLLWLNSSIGMLMYYGCRAITQGAWMQMKKPAWESMPVIDVRNLKKSQLRKLADSYDILSKESLRPLAQLADDPVRKSIDESICKAIGVPTLVVIRELLQREPGLTGSVYVPVP